MNYWQECIAEALESAGIVASNQQRDLVAEFVESAHDNYGMAHGHDCIPNPLAEENKRLSKILQDEKSKVVCQECWGRGSVTYGDGVRSATSSCSSCHGEGYK